MARGEYDPELAARSVRALAALTDAELAVAVRAAANSVLEHAEMWRRSADPAAGESGRRAYAVVTSVRDALAELPVDASLTAHVATVRPILNQWWPQQGTAASGLNEAVEQLRVSRHRS